MSALTQGLTSGFGQQNKPAHTVPQYSMGALTRGDLQQSPRKAPTIRESENIIAIKQVQTVCEQGRASIARDIAELKRSYVFANDSVRSFLEGHRALSDVLREAIVPLKEFFGADKVFWLEVKIDEDDSTMLYGVTLWRGSVRTAAQALETFVENWWLDHMTPNTTDLAFIYRIHR